MSKLKPKNKICVKCGSNEPHFSNKMCRRCALIMYQERSKQNKKTYEKPDKELSDAFFDAKISEINLNPTSFESSKVIYKPDRKNVAHLLPKKTYQKVKFKDDCWTPLTWDEHTRYDHLLDLYDFDRLVEEFPNTSKRLFDFVTNNFNDLEEHKLKYEVVNYINNHYQKTLT